jgi:hypothetical protein
LFYEKENNRYAVLVSYEGSKGKQALIPLDVDQHIKLNYMNGYSGGAYNVAVSVFNQENIKTYESDKNHVEIDLKRKDAPQRGSSSSVLSHLNETSSAYNISQPDSKSNTFSKNEAEQIELSDTTTRYSIRTEAPPENTVKGYKVFRVKDGKLYPPMVANPGGESTPVGIWLNADIGERAPDSKTGRA